MVTRQCKHYLGDAPVPQRSSRSITTWGPHSKSRRYMYLRDVPTSPFTGICSSSSLFALSSHGLHTHTHCLLGRLGGIHSWPSSVPTVLPPLCEIPGTPLGQSQLLLCWLPCMDCRYSNRPIEVPSKIWSCRQVQPRFLDVRSAHSYERDTRHRKKFQQRQSLYSAEYGSRRAEESFVPMGQQGTLQEEKDYHTSFL
jgi:hypothetical protein